MKLEKGRQKTGGRKSGVPNKATADIKATLKKIVEGNLETLMADFKSLSPIERAKTLQLYLQYVMPKMAQSSVDVTTPQGKVNLASDEMVSNFLNELDNNNL